jgi:3-dehydroquinate synthase
MRQAEGASVVATVRVETARSYPVWITRGGSRRAAELLGALEPPCRPSGWALVSDERVASLHSEGLLAGLEAWGEPVAVIRLPERERAKTWEAAGLALRRLAQAGLERGGVVVSLGGGSVGDVGGFLAGVYARGVELVNVPSTLLAMVDAAIGGKTGVNLPEGKNLVGVFHQPRAVLADLELLATLPESEWRNGWAEAIKIAITSDPELFELLETAEPLTGTAALERAVERACRAKAGIVSVDERESGLRRVLNFGHTVGHAIEAAGGYARWSHGESVALGIACELELGVRLGVTPAAVASRSVALLARYGLPVRGSGFGPDELAPFLRLDKKNERGETGVLLTVQMGNPILRRLAPGDPDLREAIRSVS